MKRDPFDERCSCGHETETHVCICTKKLTPPKEKCPDCAMGRHRMWPRNKPLTAHEVLRVLKGE